MKKVVAILLGIALVSFASFGCILKENGGSYEPPTILTDSLETFYLNDTKDKIIVIGQNYHYILQQGDNNDPKTKNIFFNLLEKSKTEPITFNISKDKNSNFVSYKEQVNNIDAYFRVIIDKSASAKLLDWAENLKVGKYKSKVFYKDPNKRYLSTDIFLKGHRYQAVPEINTKLTTLVHPINIEIRDQSLGKQVPTTPLKLDTNDSLTLNNQKLFLLDNLENKLR
jgi:hypothetical protein